MSDTWKKEPPESEYCWAKNDMIGEWVADLTIHHLFTDPPDTMFGPRIPSPDELAAMERVCEAAKAKMDNPGSVASQIDLGLSVDALSAIREAGR